ncbi:13390_t:CDS:2, partial [Cetraspora pellucida]
IKLILLAPAEIFKAVQLVATSFLEKDLIYDKLAANFLLNQIYSEIFGEITPSESTYQQLFVSNIQPLVTQGVLDKCLLDLDLPKLSLTINEPDRNNQACRFYNLISNLRFVPSTPTLFHAPTNWLIW